MRRRTRRRPAGSRPPCALAGIDVWRDRGELRGGDSWDETIRRQIRDCALFVPVISSSAAARLEGYFRLEWTLADERVRMMARDRVFIVPVCIDATRDAGAPESFLRAQWTRLDAGAVPPEFAARIRALLDRLDAPSTGRPVPRARRPPSPDRTAGGPERPAAEARQSARRGAAIRGHESRAVTRNISALARRRRSPTRWRG